MIGTDTLELWASKGHFTDWERKIERSTGLRAEIVFACQGIPAGEAWTTTALIASIHPKASKKAKDYWCNGAQYMRRHNLIPGFWRFGPPNKGTFGRPSVLWINPSAPPMDEHEAEADLAELLK